MVTIIIFNLIFVVLIGMANGYIAKELDVLYKGADNKFDAELDGKYKGQWHNCMLALRVLIPIMVAFIIAFFIDGFTNPTYSNLWFYIKTAFVSMSAIGLTIQFIAYDTIIDLSRGTFTWKFNGHCEKWGDFDCFWLKLQEWHINHLVVKALIGAVIIYFLF